MLFRSVEVKRTITNTLKKIQGTIEQYGRKSIIRGYVKILEESLNEAEVLSNQLLAMLPENEHEMPLTGMKKSWKELRKRN